MLRTNPIHGVSGPLYKSDPQSEARVPCDPKTRYVSCKAAPILIRICAKHGFFGMNMPFPERVLTIIGATCMARHDGAESWGPEARGLLRRKIYGHGPEKRDG